MYRRIDTRALSASCPDMDIHGAMMKAGLPQAGKRGWKIRKGRWGKYFFTEEGWRQFGSKFLSTIRAHGAQAKIVPVKEKDPLSPRREN